MSNRYIKIRHLLAGLLALVFIWSLGVITTSIDAFARPDRPDIIIRQKTGKLLPIALQNLPEDSTIIEPSARRSQPYKYWYFNKRLKKTNTNQPYWPVRKDIDCLVMRCVALTFDDGPSDVTNQLLDILASKDAVATFFVYGSFIDGKQGVLQKMIAANNEIGNHSTTHKSFRKINAAGVSAEVNLTQEAVFAATGYRPHIVRPPYGDIPNNDSTLANYPLIMWSNDPQDWNGKLVGSIKDRVLANIKPGAIVIMHDLKPNCLSEMPALIDELQHQGYVLATISELFNWRDPATPLPNGQVLRSSM